MVASVPLPSAALTVSCFLGEDALMPGIIAIFSLKVMASLLVYLGGEGLMTGDRPPFAGSNDVTHGASTELRMQIR